jgi:TetR/AcrR family transcriptional regulator, transcriptional repressor of aconitase
MPKVSQEYLDARRSEILDAAIVCFARDGFHCTTMQDIVRQSGLSPGAIYNYFKSKEEMIEAIANRRQAKERQLVIEAINGGPADEALVRLRDAFLDDLSNAKERLRRRVSVQLWAEAQRNAKVRKVVERSYADPRELMSHFFVEAQKRGAIANWVDSDALASFVIALFHGLVLQNEWDKQFSVESHKELLNVLLNAIARPKDADFDSLIGPTLK